MHSLARPTIALSGCALWRWWDDLPPAVSEQPMLPLFGDGKALIGPIAVLSQKDLAVDEHAHFPRRLPRKESAAGGVALVL